MKKALHLIMALAACIVPLSASAEPSTDAEGMPIIYLRGDFGNNNWGIQNAYRFTRSGNVYSLTINSSNAIGNCKFKISDDEWIFNLGADVDVNSPQYVNGIRNGKNMRTNGLKDAVISFTYNPDNTNATIKFVVDGVEPSLDIPPVSGLSGSLPVLYINVYTNEDKVALNNEVISKDLSHKNYFEYADYWLDLNGCKWLEELGAESVGSSDKPLPLQIKARGNWTRIGFAKKPFKLKLDKKQSLLGLSKSKHFAILAHADDTYGYLRNFTGFNLAHRIGLPWSPSAQPVEVVINGDYRGIYFLTESIRVDEDRVNITELNDNETDSKLVSGGYIVELDNYDEPDINQIRMDEAGCVSGQHYDPLRITFDTPEEYSEIQRMFITDQFTAINDAVGRNDDKLWSYLDLDDAARYYLVQEITSHVESYHGSTYLFRDYGDGQKWHFSPVWDFGNAFNGRTDDFLYNCDPFGNTWIPSMRVNDKFNAKVRETWLWFMQNKYSGIEDDINEFASRVQAAAQADYQRWRNDPVPAGGQNVADNRDMSGKASAAISHLRKKTDWLKGEFGDYTRGTYSEPARDTTPAAPLPSYVATGITDVEEIDIDTPAEYFNLQGLKVARPVPGEIYILRKGSKSAKIVF
ncbi:MAG: CotH kinase family protein [Muribaculaceae bacterium]|nr:CotH kinase family protein [Muribaculaceae bacterium]